MRLTIYFILFIIGYFHSLDLSAQKFDYGLNFLYNRSSQTNYDPTIPEDGEFQTNFLGTFGCGAFILREIGTKKAIQLNLNFQQKGFKDIYQYGIIGGPPTPLSEPHFKNTFNYISVDFLAKYMLLNGQAVDLSLNSGIEYSYLVDYQIESDTYPFNTSYPVNAYQDQWEKNNLSLLISFSLVFDRATSLEFGFNRSITPVLKTDNLIVKDWIWTVRVGISLPNTFTSKKNVPKIR